jgi:hypothetical protein
MLQDSILIEWPVIEVEAIKMDGVADEQLRPYLGDWDGGEHVVPALKL